MKKRNSKRRPRGISALFSFPTIAAHYSVEATATAFHGDCLDLLAEIPEGAIQLAVTSPPYNLGKKYEKRIGINDYYQLQKQVITECARRLSLSGSICWQVGNHVVNNTIMPLDILLFPIFKELGFVLRNRIIWHFEHGLHCTNRLSGRYETILWFTRPGKDYVFNLDPIRVPQKYPGKRHYKGPKAGQFSANPLGKNPGDVWMIPNVKHNHVEKTDHPCQFPVELVERLVLALTDEGDLVVDPFMGAGSALVAALMNRRRSAGADIVKDYVKITRRRLDAAHQGNLRVRPRNRPVYTPQGSITVAPWAKGDPTRTERSGRLPL
ncbi:MAG TPA: site-specific DNA-methyltransferase [Candidatus Rubrimentiphilum sp.]|nr:site-specific DNA-methyltransferase [Candidatus Rubrimentiphilum sp.]